MEEIEAVSIILKNQYKTRISDVCPKNRKKYNTMLRQSIQSVLYRYSTLSTTMIGFHLGQRDHATITHSEGIIRKAEELYNDYKIKDEILKIYQEFERRYLEYMKINNMRCERRERSCAFRFKRY